MARDLDRMVQSICAIVLASVSIGPVSAGVFQIKQSPWRSTSENPERRIADFATYAWNPAQRSTDRAKPELVEAVVDSRLKEKKYELVATDAEVLVSYTLELFEEVLRRPRERQTWWDEPGPDEPWDYLIWSVLELFQEKADPHSVVIQKLVLRISFEEAESGIWLWEAEGTYPWMRRMTDTSVAAAVEDLLRTLPAAEKMDRREIPQRDSAVFGSCLRTPPRGG